MAGKPCTECGYPDKKAGNPRFCWECWLKRQIPDIQVEQSQIRASYIPDELRLSRVPKEEWPEGRRWCAGCQSFVRLRDCGKGQTRCKGCATKALHGSQIAQKYGIDTEDYDALLKAQGGVCALCHRPPRKRRLAVDHNHATGEVRGLICGGTDYSCNVNVIGTIEGITQDSALEMAKRIVAYFEEPPARPILAARRARG